MDKLIVFIFSLFHYCITVYVQARAVRVCVCVCVRTVGRGGGSDQRAVNTNSNRNNVYHWEVPEFEMNAMTDEMLGCPLWEEGRYV